MRKICKLRKNEFGRWIKVFHARNCTKYLWSTLVGEIKIFLYAVIGLKQWPYGQLEISSFQEWKPFSMRKFPTTLYLLCAVCTNSYLETVKNFRSSSQIKSISILTLNIDYSNKDQNKKVQTLKKEKESSNIFHVIFFLF